MAMRYFIASLVLLAIMGMICIVLLITGCASPSTLHPQPSSSVFHGTLFTPELDANGHTNIVVIPQ